MVTEAMAPAAFTFALANGSAPLTFHRTIVSATSVRRRRCRQPEGAARRARGRAWPSGGDSKLFFALRPRNCLACPWPR